MSGLKKENQREDDAKVLKLGFNISVSGDPDIEIVLDNKEQNHDKEKQLQLFSSDVIQTKNPTAKLPKNEVENVKNLDVVHSKNPEIIPKQSNSSETVSELIEDKNMMSDEEPSIIKEIKSTMEHFEKFSDHIKDIPRLKSQPVAASTPVPDRSNSKSDSNLIYPDYRFKRYPHLHDYYSKKEYLKGKTKPLPPDLFLRPLPGEDLYKRGIATRYFDLEPYRSYGSVENLYKGVSNNSKLKYDVEPDSSDLPTSILKKSDSESGDKQSTSSADSVKDIKIYQSGGILIMQNFKDNLEAFDKKELSEFSAKLIENCNKLKEDLNTEFPITDEKLLTGSLSDECKGNGKMVHFDLSGSENKKCKSGDSVSTGQKDESVGSKIESSESTNDFVKNKENSPQGTSLSQEFTSLSTQENDSILSNQTGMSPTFGASGKKLEWDSGADVGYLNLDLSKENLSTIERIVLKGLGSDGLSEKKVVFEKQTEPTHTNRSKFILERIPSELVIEEVTEIKELEDEKNTSNEPKKDEETLIKTENEQVEKERKSLLEEGSKGESNSKPEELNFIKDKNEELSKKHQLKSKSVQLSDKSVNVNTLFKDSDSQVENIKTDNWKLIEPLTKFKSTKSSPKCKRSRKKRGQKLSLTGPLKEKIDTIIDIARCSARGNNSDTEMGIPKRVYRKVEAKPEFSQVELSREIEEIVIDQRFKIKQNFAIERDTEKNSEDAKKETKNKARPVSASSSSNNTVLQNNDKVLEDNKAEELKKTADESRRKRQHKTTECNTEEKHKRATEGSLRESKHKKTENNGVEKKQEAKKDSSLELQRKTEDCTTVSDLKIVQNIQEKNQSKIDKSKFMDQIIQTNELLVESVGIQAFSSQQSSDCDNVSFRKPEVPKKRETNTSSKNIQAFGLNCSLPKELAYPNETKLESQNTKSTQFFGGPINSLPNYHCNLVTKPVEACGRMPKLLKTKKKLEAEIIRLKEENDINIKANEEQLQRVEPNDYSKKTSTIDVENKENLLLIKNSRSSQNTSNSYGGCSDSRQKKDRKIHSTENSKCFQLSEDLSIKALTSEMLREHGGSIDRNIIQEKYFESQLIEIRKRQMIEKSTSMDKICKSENESQKECVSVSCQYSPQWNGSESEGEIKIQKIEQKAEEKKNSKTRKKKTSKPYVSSQNLDKNEHLETLQSTNQEQDFGAGDSLPSSTQTAHSWVPGIQDFTQSNSNGVGRARSFEYLPGDIYESTGHIREELPSDTEPNVITYSSSGSTDSGKLTNADGTKDSEGRNTLVLENSTESSQDMGPMKTLDKNLTQLNLVVTKLREKDAKIQNITQSLLVNLWKKNGSGDCIQNLDATSTPKTEILDSKNVMNFGSGLEGSGDSNSYQKPVFTENLSRENEISIGCQTEDKSPVSDSEKFFQERKALEKRISEEKESQIKWIENEIYHLNILRGLLEKQSNSNQNKEKNSTSSSGSINMEKIEDKCQKNELVEIPYQPDTSVYGCTISFLENSKENRQRSVERVHKNTEGHKIHQSLADGIKYGMALSLTGGSRNLRHVVTLPVGVKVKLRNKQLVERIAEESVNRPNDCPQSTDVQSGQSQPRNNEESVARVDSCTQSTEVFPSQNQPRNNEEALIRTNPCPHSTESRTSQDLFRKPEDALIHVNPCSHSGENQSMQHLSKNNEEASPTADPYPPSTESHTSQRQLRNNEEAANPSVHSNDSHYSHRETKQQKTNQSDVTTQYPSTNKEIGPFSSALVQTDFECPCKCDQCLQESCLRPPSSDKGNESNRRTLVSGRRQLIQNNPDKYPPEEKKKEPTEDKIVVREVFYESKNLSEKNQEESKSNSPLGFPTNKPTKIQCKCRNYSRPSPAVSRPITANSCSCHSNVNREKFFNDLGPQRFCKIQIQPCSCQVAKSQGVRGFLREDGGHINDKKIPFKKTEDRGSQTEDIEVILKDTVYNPEIVTPAKGPKVIYPSENKVGVEKKKPVIKKTEIVPKVGYEVRDPSTQDLKIMRRSALEKRSSEETFAPEAKASKVSKACQCQKVSRKEKADDHPRHYFLKIEETEIDESNESLERRKSLEIITVTVPVKKAGKSKIVRRNLDELSESEDPFDRCCKCCEVFDKIAEKMTQIGNPRLRSASLESGKKNSIDYTLPSDADFYDDINYNYNQEKYSYASSQENSEEKNTIEYRRSDIYGGSGMYENGSFDSQKECDCECGCVCGCGCVDSQTIREHESEYDSHKEENYYGARRYDQANIEEIRKEQMHNRGRRYERENPPKNDSHVDQANIEEICKEQMLNRGRRYDRENPPKNDPRVDQTNIEEIRKEQMLNRGRRYDRENPPKNDPRVDQANVEEVRKEQMHDRGRRHERDNLSKNDSHVESKRHGQKYVHDRYNSDYYNYNKKEFMTKSELMKEKEKESQNKQKTYQPTLQEYLASNRPDFYSNAENRRRVILERSQERARRHDKRIECLMNLIHHCNEENKNAEIKQMFTTSKMRQQTMKKYKKLPEVAEKKAEQKKKQEYKANKIVADVFSKKLQIEALKGHLNLSHSISVLSTI